jgi:hypothetical protein
MTTAPATLPVIADVWHCPECGNLLVKCPATDCNGRAWYECEAQETIWHVDDLERIEREQADADAADLYATAESVRASLY